MWAEQAEKSVLGSMIAQPDVIPLVMAQVEPEHFFLPEHREIFDLLIARFMAGRPIDELLIGQDLKNRDRLNPQELVAIVDAGQFPANAEYHAKEVRDKARYRELMLVVDKIGKALDPAKDIGEMVIEIQDLALRVDNKWETEEYVNAIDIAGSVIADHNKHEESLPTGLANLDWHINGMRPGELIIVAGRPGQGKSAICLSIIQRQTCRCLIVSLEMSKKSLIARALGAIAKVDMTDKKLAPDQYDSLRDAVSQIANVYISTSAYTVPKIQALVKRLSPKLLVIDHVGLMAGPGSQKIDVVTEISRRLKLLAVQENIPILLISQLNRQVEARQPKIPRLSDLRDSGALEQDADMVWMLYRPKYYDPDLDDNTAQLRIEKNRRGRVGTAQLVFLEKYVSFEDAARL